MGYKLTSLVNLPLEPEIDMYVFSIGDGLWEGGLSEIVKRNVDGIAREIGPRAIIVGALQASFHGEVVERYLGRHARELKNLLPALLITDAHPRKLTEDSLRLLVPLQRAHERYEAIEQFLSDLAAFVRGESSDLLRRLENAQTLGESPGDVVEVSLPVVPGVVAVNVNNAAKRLASAVAAAPFRELPGPRMPMLPRGVLRGAVALFPRL